jgi:uncharacterized protein (UPF0264 family)
MNDEQIIMQGREGPSAPGPSVRRSALLVSVRSVTEARAALAGGAGLIDVKEPGRGPLGRADEQVIVAVLRDVRGRRLVSAALGELSECCSLPSSCRGLSFVKWGLAGWGRGDWQTELARQAARVQEGDASCRVVAVAYADWLRADAPCPEAVGAFARERRLGALLVDTFGKDGTSLLDWLPLTRVRLLCRRCQAAGVPVALAGSLGPEQIRALREVGPDWFAVRGAACRVGRRTEAIDPARVRRLADLLAEPVTASTCES